MPRKIRVEYVKGRSKPATCGRNGWVITINVSRMFVSNRSTQLALWERFETNMLGVGLMYLLIPLAGSIPPTGGWF